MEQEDAREREDFLHRATGVTTRLTFSEGVVDFSCRYKEH